MKNASSVNFIIRWLIIISLTLSAGAYAENFTIIESQSMMPGHDMDVIWEEIIIGMQHQASIQLHFKEDIIGRKKLMIVKGK